MILEMKDISENHLHKKSYTPPAFLPKLLQFRFLLLVEFPFPFERGGGGIVFPVFLRRFALVVGGSSFDSFLSTGQQAIDEKPLWEWSVKRSLYSITEITPIDDPTE